ncbi:MAG: proteasome assembly chaperone family protein [Candidatus Bathyarchaeia archaeon]|nr:proteasome assembly chaperone family protein [Candidatus Bathyarchaeota archaeon]
MDEEIKIIEVRKAPKEAYMIFGFPDVGLVGVIAASHLITELGLTEIAYIESKLLPPVTVLHEGLPHSPIRVYGNHQIMLAVSEIPLQEELVHPVTRKLIDWGREKEVKLMISLSGIPVPGRQDLEELKVFAAASTGETLKMIQEKGVEILMEGYMVGPQAVMLQYCATLKLPAVTLLSQCFFNYPDPEAAAKVLDLLANIIGVKVDVSKLIEKGEEIRIKARDIMRRTQQELAKMGKSQEFDIPLYIR